jgi:hypothetical protein
VSELLCFYIYRSHVWYLVHSNLLSWSFLMLEVGARL